MRFWLRPCRTRQEELLIQPRYGDSRQFNDSFNLFIGAGFLCSVDTVEFRDCYLCSCVAVAYSAADSSLHYGRRGQHGYAVGANGPAVSKSVRGPRAPGRMQDAIPPLGAIVALAC